MEISMLLNGNKISANIKPDMVLLDFLRDKGCYSVKRGCETANCGLCTVLLDGKPVLSCSVLAVRADGHQITTLEGLQEKAKEIGSFLASDGAEQCGFCNPGLIMNVIAMERELTNPTEAEVREYLAGNLCRCTGFTGQSRSLQKYLLHKAAEKEI
ncbi:MAG: 2Fe-2S iron-sulfur cluster binding domain-containing protein [Blautia sp.]|nr:2Fe-2S iron-sulfur cluster binding domain-containing protein [Blautia sp.]